MIKQLQGELQDARHDLTNTREQMELKQLQIARQQE